MKKHFILKTSVIALTIILLLQVATFAAVNKLTVKTTTSKDTYEVGEKVTVTVDWKEGMQAVVFKLNYDKDKLTFDNASIIEDCYDSTTKPGTISVNWMVYPLKNETKMTFEFTAKKEGKVEFTVTGAKFMDGDTNSPTVDITSSASKTITINTKATTPENKPTAVTLSSIAITKTPIRNTYSVGEKFEKAGMEITATYSDGSKKVVTNYTYSPAETLKESDTKLVISYTENGVTKQTEQKITVIGENTNGNIENNKNNPTTNKKDNTTASGKMPQTGAENIVFIIALVSVVGTIGFIKYRKLSDI